MVTAGPTYEPLDPVRFIGNYSSGKMGVAIARELQNQGAAVTLILGPSSEVVSSAGIKLVRVTTAEEMYDACNEIFEISDIAVMAAAVADYTPVQKAREKIKKKEETLTLELTKTKDILKTLGGKKKKGQVLVGFALETNNEKDYAREKLEKKNADLIVMNSLKEDGAGFGYDTNKITIFGKTGGAKFDMKSNRK
jgi:phosphopantothenoylcysteine decarboxylase/phosphopantothenate--cysteine ligase